ncbi:MAG: universal stress protein [Caldilineaceae bacterium]
MAIRTILIPLDESEYSRQIVRVVRAFISPDDVEIVLFRAADDRSPSPSLTFSEGSSTANVRDGSYEANNRTPDAERSAANQQRVAARERIEAELAEEVGRLNSAGYSARAEVSFGEPAQRIIEYVNNHHVDLVAMTTHGRRGLDKLVLGSVTERVQRGVSVPVLLMRSEAAGDGNKDPDPMFSTIVGNSSHLRIAAATDCSMLSLRAVSQAAELASALHATMELLVVAGEQDSAEKAQSLMDTAMEQVAGLECRPLATPLVGYADEAVLQHLADHPVDLLVIGAFQDRGAASTSAIGPTAQRLVQYAPCSVLVYKGHRSHFRRILVCLSVDDADRVDAAARSARTLGAEISVLHVIPQSAASYLSDEKGEASGGTSAIALSQVISQGTPLSAMLQGWIARLDEHGVGPDAVLLAKGSLPEAILRTAQDGAHDLIVLGSHAPPARFPSSVANEIVRYAEQSVLLLRNASA